MSQNTALAHSQSADVDGETGKGCRAGGITWRQQHFNKSHIQSPGYGSKLLVSLVNKGHNIIYFIKIFFNHHHTSYLISTGSSESGILEETD